MKKVVYSIMALTFSFVAPIDAEAGWGQQFAEKMSLSTGYLEDKGETIASMNVDLLTASSRTKSFTRTLYSGNNYTAVAIGDSRIKDTDLIVYRKSGNSWYEVKRDADTSNVAVVSFNCDITGEYKFEVKAYSFKSDYSQGFYGLIVSY